MIAAPMAKIATNSKTIGAILIIARAPKITAPKPTRKSPHRGQRRRIDGKRAAGPVLLRAAIGGIMGDVTYAPHHSAVPKEAQSQGDHRYGTEPHITQERKGEDAENRRHEPRDRHHGHAAGENDSIAGRFLLRPVGTCAPKRCQWFLG